MGNLSALTRRYIWLIDIIQRAGNISYNDINAKWKRDAYLFDEPATDIPKRTFHRQKTEIYNLFGIDIKCDRSDNTYFIDHEYSDSKGTLTKNILSNLSLEFILRNNPEAMSHIVFEETSGGMDFLLSLIDALINHNILEIQYHNYNSIEIQNFNFHTYGLKQSAQRWYAIGLIEGKTEIMVLALDRILDIKKKQRMF